MSRLTQKAPESVFIDEVYYPINTNFRDCILCIHALQDKDLTQDERIQVLLYNIYDELPEDWNKAVEMALWFLRCGKPDEKSKAEKLCDFGLDSDYIYSAILKKGVDLDQCDGMHWWKFMSYFSEIDESSFSRIVYLRSQKNRGKLTKEEKAECARIGWNTINMIDSEDESVDGALNW